MFSASPSMSLPVIDGRLDLAEYILGDPELREGLVTLLCRTADSNRIVQKFSLGRGDSDDLIALGETIRATKEIAKVLAEHHEAQQESGSLEGGRGSFSDGTSRQQSCIGKIISRLKLDGPCELAERIAAAIDEEGVNQLHRFEQAESAAAAALAQEVESSRIEGVVATESKSRPTNKPKSETVMTPEIESQDVWVMRKEYVFHSMYQSGSNRLLMSTGVVRAQS